MKLSWLMNQLELCSPKEAMEAMRNIPPLKAGATQGEIHDHLKRVTLSCFQFDPEPEVSMKEIKA